MAGIRSRSERRAVVHDEFDLVVFFGGRRHTEADGSGVAVEEAAEKFTGRSGGWSIRSESRGVIAVGRGRRKLSPVLRSIRNRLLKLRTQHGPRSREL